MGFMNKLDKTYTDLLQDILDNGVKKQDRTGTGTISVFGRQIRHKMSTGFPLLTSKHIKFDLIVTELLWFLRGDTNIKYLVDNNCHIWDGDAYKSYEQSILESFDRLSNDPAIDAMPPRVLSQEEFINKIKTDDVFANKWGDLGPIYGKQWRSWGGELVTKRIKEEGKFPVSQNVIEGPIDQIQNLINELKTNPDSRRLMVNSWNVGEISEMVLPPCHYGFQVYTRELSLEERKNIWLLKNSDKPHLLYHPGMVEKSHPLTTPQNWFDEQNIPTRAISLMWNQRSVDTFLGLPFNIASYGLLLEIIAKEVNMVPDQLIGNLGDVHLYSNHIDAAKEQIGRERTHEEMVEIYNNTEDKKDREGLWTWSTRFEDNGIDKKTREPFDLPKLVLNPIFLANLEHKGFDEAINGQVNFEVENYQSHTAIPAPLSN